MKVSACLVILMAGATALKWSANIPPIPHGFGDKMGCYIKELNDVISFNETVNALGYCYLVHCSVYQIDYVSCGWSSHNEDNDDCVITQSNMDEPYPECCPKVVCLPRDIPWTDKNETEKYYKTKELVWKL